jgi:hypothetical protein
MKEPLSCLERLRAVTREVAVIETEAVHLQHLENEVLLQFHAGDSLRTDFGNWYVPTIEALHHLCRAAGFSEVRTIVGPPDPLPLVEGSRAKLARLIQNEPMEKPSAPSQNYRAVVHAFP